MTFAWLWANKRYMEIAGLTESELEKVDVALENRLK